jgi:hypothetical protein
MVLVWGLIGTNMVRSEGNKPDPSLQKFQGRVRLDSVEAASGDKKPCQHTSLYIDGQEFYVETRLANFLVQGDNYAFYVIRDTGKIMSVEWISK